MVTSRFLNGSTPTCQPVLFSELLSGVAAEDFLGLLATLPWLQDTIERFLVSNMLNSELHIAAKQIKFLGERCMHIDLN